LWAGLPVITKAGKSLGGRMAASALTAVEMTELITSNELDYKKLTGDLDNTNFKSDEYNEYCDGFYD
jgi:predicted O-linked N-acetylglucosamine transferase (SPINDLY family)